MKFKDIGCGKVSGLYLSKYSEQVEGDDYLLTKPVPSLSITLEGIHGDRHYGITGESDSRVLHLYERGTTIRNNRQWSAISEGELEKIARKLKIPTVVPEVIGINILLEGVPNLSEFPPLTYLLFTPHDEPKFVPDYPVLVTCGQILPCHVAGKALAQWYNRPHLEKKFPKASLGLRGLTGWVEKEGSITPGLNVFVMTPTGKD